MSASRKRSDILSVLVIIVTALAMLFACNMDSSTSGSSDDDGEEAKEGKNKEPEIKVAVADILTAYKDNEVSADSKYKGKWVEITGKVGEIKKDLLDSVYITVGTGAAFELPMVQCFVKKSMVKKSGELKKGQDITVKGRVDGLLMNVLVKECTF